MSLNQFIAILKARKWLFLALMSTIVLTTLAVSLLIPKRYTATAAVVVDVKSPDPIAGVVLQGVMLPSYMATQSSIIDSERVALRVIRRTNMGENPAVREQWAQETGGVGDMNAWLAEQLRKNLEVKPARESNVINISYSAQDANAAAVLTNAFVQSYIETTVDLRVEPAKQYMALFEGQTKQLRDRLEQAQSALSAYQQEKGIIATDERLDVESQRLNDLSSQVVALQSMADDAASRRESASANSAEVLNNPVIASLKAEAARAEARLKELSARLSSAHPQVAEAQASLNELRIRIDAETARVTSSLGINSSVNKYRLAQVKAAMERQRQTVAQLKQRRDDAAVLIRDVENAQRAYDAMQARLQQTSLESQTNQGNVSVLKMATVPYKPSSPRLLLNLLVATVLGLFFALGVTLASELLNRKVRTEDDVPAVLDLPLLTSMPALSLGQESTQSAKLLQFSGKDTPQLNAPRQA
jgi:polysaccharide biosynthesis transport protein